MINNYQIEISNKFKTNYIIVRYFIDANEKNASLASLLSLYLPYVNSKFPTYQQALNNLDSLYGLRVDSSVSIKTNLILFDFSLYFVSSKFIKDDNYINKVIETYLDYLFNPLIVNNLFDSQIFNNKKYELEQRILSSYDDKMTYAIDQFLDVFSQDTYLKLNTYGDLATVKRCSNEMVYAFYQEMIGTIPLVYMHLHNNDLLCKKLLQEKIESNKLNSKFSLYNLNVVTLQEVIEKQDLVQSKLVLGYVVPNTINNKEYYKYLVFNSLFGMSSNSYLFKIVREKENLCYSIRANYDYYSNTFLVFAGIQKENYEKTCLLIEQILEKIKSGSIDISDFEDAKIVLIDTIAKIKDSQAGIVNYKANRLLSNFTMNIDDDIKAVNEVSINDIIDVAKSMKLTTKYLLSGEKNE